MAKTELIDKQELQFSEALYSGCCAECKSHLGWRANFDADGTTYSAECCGKYYFMAPNTVKISVEAT